MVLRSIAFATFFLTAANATAALIDFEQTALGQTPKDNLMVDIADRFSIGDVFVRFGFDTNNDGDLDAHAVFEEAENKDAGEDTGFWGLKGARDEAAPGFESQLGRFFLRQKTPYMPFGTFRILYDSKQPVTAASGEIWDIDGNKRKTEQFLVEAFNGNTVLDSMLSPLGKNSKLDGRPWTFRFSGLSDIDRIDVSFVGSKTRGIGLAFNNFAPTTENARLSTVSEPSTVFLFVFASLALMFAQLKRR